MELDKDDMIKDLQFRIAALEKQLTMKAQSENSNMVRILI